MTCLSPHLNTTTQYCCGGFLVPQQCTGTSDTQGVITTTNHFLVSVPPPKLSFSSSLFLFPLSSTPYRTELVYISIREQGLELARGRACVQADSSPQCPTPAHLKWKQQHSAVWSPVSQKPCGPLRKSVCLWWTGRGGGNMSRFVCYPLCPPLQFFHFIFSLSHIHTSKDSAIFSLSLLFTFPHGMP